MIRKTLALPLLVTATAGFLLGSAVQDNEVTTVQPAAAPRVSTLKATELPTRPCTEDDAVSRNCYWDAAKMGNGKGYSYFVDRAGEVFYLNPKLNNKTARLKFNAAQKKAGKELWGTVDGHRFCWAKVGDTSYVTCFDGYKTTS